MKQSKFYLYQIINPDNFQLNFRGSYESKAEAVKAMNGIAGGEFFIQEVYY